MAEKESFEKIIRRIAGIIDSMEKEAKARGKKVTSTKKKTPETEPEETKKVKKVTTTEEETPEVTPAKKKTPVKKTKPINANIFNIPLGEPKKTEPEKTKRAAEFSRVYTKPSKVQEMHRRRRKGGKSFTRQGASKLIDKTDKATVINLTKTDMKKAQIFEGKRYEKDLTSGGSRGSALTATGGNSITKQMELYRQNRKRKKRGR